jgi:hypothetical protein
MPDDGWATSTEGDLDPDLTEEAGYSAWEPAQRGAWWMALRLTAGLLLLAIVVGALLVLAR